MALSVSGTIQTTQPVENNFPAAVQEKHSASKKPDPQQLLPDDALRMIFRYAIGPDRAENAGDAIQMLCTARELSSGWRQIIDKEFLGGYWRLIKELPHFKEVHPTMERIEQRSIRPLEPILDLRNAPQLEQFATLSTVLGAPRHLGISPRLYKRHIDILQDDFLEKIWKSNHFKASFRGTPPKVPKPIAAVGIRAALNDPTNEARIGTVTGLDFDGYTFHEFKLKVLPPEMGKFTALTALSLTEHLLQHLPADIGKLTSLKTFCLSNNQLLSIPPEIGKLTALTKLSLSNNQLLSIPPEIGKLTALIQLYLAKNKLQRIPAEIGNLTALTYLSLENNQLLSIPATVSNLTALQGSSTPLKWFTLYGNPLLFRLNHDLSESTAQRRSPLDEEMAKHQACAEYECRTPLAALCQAIHRGEDGTVLQEKFAQLSEKMQESIRTHVEGDLFVNRLLFGKAVIAAIQAKFNSLSEEEKKGIDWHIWNLAKRPQVTQAQFEKHKASNIIRLIDVIELATGANY